MKRFIAFLLALLPVLSFAGNRQDFIASVCANQKVVFHFNGVEFAPQSVDDVPTAFGTPSHRGITKNFDNDTAVVAIISDAVKEACSRVERGVISSVNENTEGALDATVSCEILSVSSTVEERRGGTVGGGVWASIRLNLSIADAAGNAIYSNKVVSEGRSHGGFNINLSSVEDAAGRMACFLGEELRVVFPISGLILEPYIDTKSPKTAFTVSLGTDDNVYSGGMATYRVSKVVEDGDSFKLVEIGSGYIYDVVDAGKSIFRITYGAGAVKAAFESGETLVIRSK